MNARLGVWVCLHALVFIACGDTIEPTEIVVVVDSDLRAPQEIDAVRVVVRRERDDAEMQSAAGPVLGDAGTRLFPLTVGVTHGGGELGPILVTVSGLLDSSLVVERVARVSFVRHKRVALRMNLVRACAVGTGPVCGLDETCIDGDCGSLDVAESELGHFTGVRTPLEPTKPVARDAQVGMEASVTDARMPLDAGSMGGSDTGPPQDACVRANETCNGLDDDCDGDADEDFDLNSLERCGSCDNTCPVDVPFAASVCQSGNCALVCAPGTGHCDTDLTNGCETLLTDPATCGDCDTACMGGTPLCSSDTSQPGCVGVCSGATPDQCGSSCVDTTSDPFHCGACSTPCPSPANARPMCSPGGNCTYMCLGMNDDCDLSAANGCEVDLQTNLAHCGSCNNACPQPLHTTATCVGGTCGFRCHNGFTDCNGKPGDGCEIDTNNDDGNCGACGKKCTGLNGCCAGTCKLLSLCT